MEELLILIVESLQRKISKECSFQSLRRHIIIALVLVSIDDHSSN